MEDDQFWRDLVSSLEKKLKKRGLLLLFFLSEPRESRNVVCVSKLRGVAEEGEVGEEHEVVGRVLCVG